MFGLFCLSRVTAAQTAAKLSALIDVTVSEGTSMSVGVSPDGKTLAMDMQGSIWVIPRVWGGPPNESPPLFNDRSPAGLVARRQVDYVFRISVDGGYDLLDDLSRSGTNQHKLTCRVAYDDREPAYSHDGTHDRCIRVWTEDDPLGSSYNIWTLDLRSGEIKRITNNPSENHMPTWSPE